MILDAVHAEHIAGLRSREAAIDDEGLLLGEQYVMFFAEAELMRLHASYLVWGMTESAVLEVGLGLGIFAEQLAAHGVGSYTAIEPHEQVAKLAHDRVLSSYPAPVRVITEPWQLVPIPDESVDAIMYDTWPPDGHADRDFEIFVERIAMRCLRPGGRFSFFHSGSALGDARKCVLDRNFANWTAAPYELPVEAVPAGWTKPTRDFLIPVAMKAATR